MSQNIEVTCHKATHDIGHRDDGYFQVKTKDKKSPTGFSFDCYRLLSMDGEKRYAPDAVYRQIEGKMNDKLNAAWVTGGKKPRLHDSILMYNEEIEEYFSGHRIDSNCILVLTGLESLRPSPDDDQCVTDFSMVDKWMYMSGK